MPEKSDTPLIDEIYKKLQRDKQRDRFVHDYQIYVSHQQYRQLRIEATNHFTIFSIDPPSLFGYRIIVIEETPYVRRIE